MTTLDNRLAHLYFHAKYTRDGTKAKKKVTLNTIVGVVGRKALARKNLDESNKPTPSTVAKKSALLYKSLSPKAPKIEINGNMG